MNVGKSRRLARCVVRDTPGIFWHQMGGLMHLSLSIDKDVILARLAEHRQNRQPVQSVSLIVITLKDDSGRARAISIATSGSRFHSLSTTDM